MASRGSSWMRRGRGHLLPVACLILVFVGITGIALDKLHMRRWLSFLDNNQAPPPAFVVLEYSEDFSADTVVERTSVGEEISNSFGAAACGLFIFLIGFPMLWANEQRQVHMAKLFARAREIVVQKQDAAKKQFANEGRLVHMQGVTTTQEKLTDPEFHLNVEDTVKLRRVVEMFQWREQSTTTTRNLPNGGRERVTQYSYIKSWNSTSISSSSFKGPQGQEHVNPPMPCLSHQEQARRVNFGNFVLPDVLVDRLANYDQCTDVAPRQVRAAGRLYSKTQDGGQTYLYSGVSIENPEIGDMRVSFQRVPCGETTVLAVQASDTFAPMKRSAKLQDGQVALDNLDDSDLELDSGCTCCCVPCGCIGKLITSKEEVFQISSGHKSARQMFQVMASQQQTTHCVLKIAGLACIIVGLGLMGSIWPAVFRIIPYVGVWIESFGRFVIWISAFILGITLGTITVAIAWLRARPLKAILLFFAASAIFWLPRLLAYAIK